jgi:hypothetical protein
MGVRNSTTADGRVLHDRARWVNSRERDETLNRSNHRRCVVALLATEPRARRVLEAMRAPTMAGTLEQAETTVGVNGTSA